MSRMATKPSVAATWSPSRARRQKRQSSGSDDPFVPHFGTSDAHERANRSLDEPRRVVVAVAPAGTVDEDDVLPADLRQPPGATGRVRAGAKPRAPLLLHRGRDGVGGSGL